MIGYPGRQDGAILPSQDYPPFPGSKNFPESHIINHLLTKPVHSRWLDIGLIPFLQKHKNAKKKMANIQAS